jgi:predicted component of type VI protein secretion system
MGDKSTFVFGVSGGSIGRSAENDWVLPDDMRYVSGRHARIVFHKGRYSAAGHEQQRHLHQRHRQASRQEPARAESGDIVRIGEYHVQVQIDSATDFEPRRQRACTAQARPAHAARVAAQGSRRHPALENLLEASNDISSDELKPVNAFGQAVSSRARNLHHTQDLPKEPSTAPELDVDSEAVARRIARLAKATTKQQQGAAAVARSRAAHRPAPPTIRPGLQAFCRGAGFGPRPCRSTRTHACCTLPVSCCANRCSV